MWYHSSPASLSTSWWRNQWTLSTFTLNYIMREYILYVNISLNNTYKCTKVCLKVCLSKCSHLKLLVYCMFKIIYPGAPASLSASWWRNQWTLSTMNLNYILRVREYILYVNISLNIAYKCIPRKYILYVRLSLNNTYTCTKTCLKVYLNIFNHLKLSLSSVKKIYHCAPASFPTS